MNKTTQIWSTTLFVLGMIVCCNVVYQVLYRNIFNNDTFMWSIIPAVVLLVIIGLTIYANRNNK
jgi:nitric oxide reductase large subunit